MILEVSGHDWVWSVPGFRPKLDPQNLRNKKSTPQMYHVATSFYLENPSVCVWRLYWYYDDVPIILRAQLLSYWCQSIDIEMIAKAVISLIRTVNIAASKKFLGWDFRVLCDVPRSPTRVATTNNRKQGITNNVEGKYMNQAWTSRKTTCFQSHGKKKASKPQYLR